MNSAISIENVKKTLGNREVLKGISFSVVIETVQYIPESLLAELKSMTYLGLKEKKERTLIFSPQEGTEISDIISFLAGRGVKIEEATRKEASLEEMYSTILKEVEP